jgi:hypothetical protein
MQRCERGNRARLTVDQFAPGPLDKTKIKEGSQLFVAKIPDKRLRQRVEVAISAALMTAQRRCPFCQIPGCTLSRVPQTKHRSW